jgi:hypothetical protein
MNFSYAVRQYSRMRTTKFFSMPEDRKAGIVRIYFRSKTNSMISHSLILPKLQIGENIKTIYSPIYQD